MVKLQTPPLCRRHTARSQFQFLRCCRDWIAIPSIWMPIREPGTRRSWSCSQLWTREWACRVARRMYTSLNSQHSPCRESLSSVKDILESNSEHAEWLLSAEDILGETALHRAVRMRPSRATLPTQCAHPACRVLLCAGVSAMGGRGHVAGPSWGSLHTIVRVTYDAAAHCGQPRHHVSGRSAAGDCMLVGDLGSRGPATTVIK